MLDRTLGAPPGDAAPRGLLDPVIHRRQPLRAYDDAARIGEVGRIEPEHGIPRRRRRILPLVEMLFGLYRQLRLAHALGAERQLVALRAAYAAQPPQRRHERRHGGFGPRHEEPHGRHRAIDRYAHGHRASGRRLETRRTDPRQEEEVAPQKGRGVETPPIGLHETFHAQHVVRIGVDHLRVERTHPVALHRIDELPVHRGEILRYLFEYCRHIRNR